MEDLDEPVQTGAEDELAGFRDEEPEQPEDAEVKAADEPEVEPEEPEEEEPKGHYKVTYKDADGNEIEEKVSYDALQAGYLKGKESETLRQSAEAQVQKAYEEAATRVNQHSQQAQQALRVNEQMLMQVLDYVEDAGLSGDPNVQLQAFAKQQQIHKALQNVRAALANEGLLAQQEDQKAIAKAQAVLTPKGLPPAKVTALYEQISTTYGVSPQALIALRDPGLVLALKDALDHHTLKSKRPEVTKKVREAPKLPPSKTRTAPVSDDLVKRLRSKAAKGSDLEEYFKRTE